MLCLKCKKATGAADRCGTCPRDKFDAFMVKHKQTTAEYHANPANKQRINQSKATSDAKPEAKKRPRDQQLSRRDHPRQNPHS